MKKQRILSRSKLLCVLVAALMLAGMLAACGGDTTTSQAPASSSQAAAATTAAANPEQSGTPAGGEEPSGGGLPIVAEPITLRVLSETRADITQGNDMATWAELARRTNIAIEWELLPIDAAEKTTKFNVVMASGDVPDIVHHTNANNVNRYGMQGLFLPLQDLINEYGPNIVAAFNNPLEGDEIPYDINVWGQITAADGNIYTVPIISASNAIGAVWGIRTDWLEKLNLSIPTTADELYDVLVAFRDQDPNGNGEKDEIPWGAGAGGKTPTITTIMPAFDAHMDLYVDYEDGAIKYGPAEDNYRTGLEYLNKLYSEKLLEEDYLTATRDQWLARAGGNQMGMMFVWPGSGFAASNNELQKLDESYHFEPFEPFKSQSGKQYKDTKVSGNAVQYRTCVGANTRYPVEIMKLIDYCFSEEGDVLVNFGIEDEHYTMQDGKPVYTDFILKNPDGLDPETARIRQGMIWQLLPYQTRWAGHYQAMEKTAPWTVMAWDTYKKAGLVEPPMPILALSEDELSRYNSIIAEIETYRDPMIDKFIMGTESMDKFPEFVEGINRAGLTELLEIMNKAYETFKANS